jgi:hypothetical protein
MPASAGEIPETCHLFSYFLDNGQDGLHLAWSRDGLKWEVLNGGRSYLAPEVGDQLIRDPNILQGPDGIFRMVWSNSWNSQTIGYASSHDLITWSPQRAVPVMATEPGTRNCWAPELFHDASTGDYLVVWSSTVVGKFTETAATAEDDYNHRLYLARTRDFVSFTPPELLLDPGHCCIDATILPAQGKFHLIYKNEVLKPEAQKNLWIATSDAMTGPYGNITGPIATTPAHWVEGPTSIEIGGRYLIYFDCYMEGHYGAVVSRDLKTWTDITAELEMPEGARHGTVFKATRPIVQRLIEAGR